MLNTFTYVRQIQSKVIDHNSLPHNIFTTKTYAICYWFLIVGLFATSLKTMSKSGPFLMYMLLLKQKIINKDFRHFKISH